MHLFSSIPSILHRYYVATIVDCDKFITFYIVVTTLLRQKRLAFLVSGDAFVVFWIPMYSFMSCVKQCIDGLMCFVAVQACSLSLFLEVSQTNPLPHLLRLAEQLLRIPKSVPIRALALECDVLDDVAIRCNPHLTSASAIFLALDVERR